MPSVVIPNRRPLALKSWHHPSRKLPAHLLYHKPVTQTSGDSEGLQRTAGCPTPPHTRRTKQEIFGDPGPLTSYLHPAAQRTEGESPRAAVRGDKLEIRACALGLARAQAAQGVGGGPRRSPRSTEKARPCQKLPCISRELAPRIARLSSIHAFLKLNTTGNSRKDSGDRTQEG